MYKTLYRRQSKNVTFSDFLGKNDTLSRNTDRAVTPKNCTRTVTVLYSYDVCVFFFLFFADRSAGFNVTEIDVRQSRSIPDPDGGVLETHRRYGVLGAQRVRTRTAESGWKFRGQNRRRNNRVRNATGKSITGFRRTKTEIV